MIEFGWSHGEGRRSHRRADTPRPTAVRDRAPAAAARSNLWMLALLLVAFCWQSFASQTHHHAESATVLASTAVQAPDKQPGDAPPADCPICRQLANGEAYLPPAPIVLHAPLAAAFDPIASPFAATALRQRAWGWQSRAPPTTFQT